MLRLAVILGFATALAAPALAETPYKPPLAADGHPSLEGIWTNASLTRLERPARFKDHLVLSDQEVASVEGRNTALMKLGDKPTDPKATVLDLPADCSDGRGTNCNYNAAWTDPGTTVMRVGGKPVSSFITTTADGRIPMLPGARPAPPNRLKPGSSPSDNPETRALGERCLLGFGGTSGPVMLPVLYNNTYQFVQTKDQVAILVEMDHDVRIVRLGTRQHVPPTVRPWLGDSVGWWEGNTLVIETTNFHPEETLRGSSDHLKVVERLTRVSPTRIRYEFQVEDPTVFAAPWGGAYEFSSTKGPVFEYACHEGNYGLRDILSGAREEDRTGHKTAPTNIDQTVAKLERNEGEESGP